MNAHGRRLASLLPLVLAPLVMASLCKNTNESVLNPSPDEFAATVTLTNPAVDCVHLFAPGEDFPCCQVCNSERTVVMNLTRQETYTFRAGRNGEELDTQLCRAVGAQGDEFTVLWQGAGLTCRDGFSE